MTRHRQMAGSLMPICGNRMARAMRFLCFSPADGLKKDVQAIGRCVRHVPFLFYGVYNRKTCLYIFHFRTKCCIFASLNVSTR